MMRVSAIILTHNRPQLLRRAVDSVLSQTYKDIECIVVDDASDVPAKEIEAMSGVKYVYIPKEESRGGNYARNKGVEVSSGEYVAFLDDDDCWLPAKIEKQVDLITAKGCGLVYTRRFDEHIKDDGAAKIEEVEYPLADMQGDLSRKILYEIPATTSCLLMTRRFFYEAGKFDENLKYWQEYELLIRAAQKTPFYMVDEPLVMYRVDKHEKVRLSNKYYEWKVAVKYAYRKHRQLYVRLGINEKLRVKQLYYNDAKERARNGGLRWQHFKNAVLYRLICHYVG